MMSVFSLGTLLVLLALVGSPVRAQRYQYNHNNALLSTMSPEGIWTVQRSRGTYAQFSFNQSTIESTMVVAGTACSMSDVPHSPGKIVLVSRGECAFLIKAYNVFSSQAIAMVVIDHEGRETPPIMASGSQLVPFAMIEFVSIAIPYNEGKRLKKLIASEPDTLLQISYFESDEYHVERMEGLGGRVVSYTCGIAISALLLVMATRMCNRHPRQVLRPRVAASREPQENPRADELLESLPGYEFSTTEYLKSQRGSDGDFKASDAKLEEGKSRDEDDLENELPTCCVCLCNFEDGDKVSKLPCKHEFHADCIGAWLRMHAECPLCKADVYEMHFDSSLAAVNPLLPEETNADPVERWVEGLSDESSETTIRDEATLDHSHHEESPPPSPTRTLSWDSHNGVSMEHAAHQMLTPATNVEISDDGRPVCRLETTMELSI